MRRARQHSTAPAQRLGFERIDEGPPLPLRRDPFILHAHPPARLGVGVVDKHQPGLVYKAAASPPFGGPDRGSNERQWCPRVVELLTSGNHIARCWTAGERWQPQIKEGCLPARVTLLAKLFTAQTEEGKLLRQGPQRPPSEVWDIAKKFTIHIYCQGISPKTTTGNAGPLALSPSEIADFGTKFDAEATPGRGSIRP